MRMAPAAQTVPVPVDHVIPVLQALRYFALAALALIVLGGMILQPGA